jgi:hypothetical protein
MKFPEVLSTFPEALNPLTRAGGAVAEQGLGPAELRGKIWDRGTEVKNYFMIFASSFWQNLQQLGILRKPPPSPLFVLKKDIGIFRFGDIADSVFLRGASDGKSRAPSGRCRNLSPIPPSIDMECEHSSWGGGICALPLKPFAFSGLALVLS